MKNYTSTVPAERSIAEIEQLLVRAKARNIAKQYDGQGQVLALEFSLPNETAAAIYVRLPANPDAVFEVLKRSKKRIDPRSIPRLRDQARRTAWRLMLDWVAVQLSLIEMRQAELMQVFLPYVMTSGEQTFYDRLKGQKFAALTHRPAVPVAALEGDVIDGEVGSA